VPSLGAGWENVALQDWQRQRWIRRFP